MERAEILATMSELKLYGMKAAYDELIATAVKRQHEPQRVVGDLLAAEISEKQARLISPLRSPGPASGPATGGASSTSSTSSTGWKPKPGLAGRAAWLTISHAWISSFSTNSATCRSPNPAANCCST
jgi:hypothetical protein